MLLFLALCILSKSVDINIDFSKSKYDLYLNSNGVSVRKLEGSSKKVVYESTNVNDHTVHLSLGISFTSVENVLDIYVDLFKLNLDLEIICSNDEKINAGIRVHDTGNSETDYYNYYKISIHSDTIFYFDTEFWDYGMIETYSQNSLNKQLTGRLSPLYLFYDTHSYICYKNTDCLNNYNIGPYDSYFIAKNEESYNLIINNVPLNEDYSFYILLNGNSDFPKLNGILETPTETNPDDPDITFHLIGISTNPVKLSINDNIDSDKNVVFSNVQLQKAKDGELNFKFKTITIDDGTKNVFPTTGFQINCDYFIEYVTNSEPSQSTSIKGIRGFYISPDFEKKGDVYLYVSSTKVEIKNSKGVTFATVPKSSSNTEIYIENQKNLNHNKIVIKNDFGELQEAIEDSLSINFENCGQIPIEFRDWNNEKLSAFMFYIYNDMNEIYEEIITNLNSPYLTYEVTKDEEENTFNFPENVQKFVICLSAEKCSESELVGNHVYQYPINGENINELLSSFFENYAEVESLTLVLNDNFRGKALDLPPKTFKSISFIYNNENNEPLPITLSAISGELIDHMEIRKCKISTECTVSVDQLFVSSDGEITGDNVHFNAKISEEKVDISKNDKTLTLTDNPLKVLVKSGNSPHKLIFNANKKFTCTIYIQSCDGSYTNIPISFSEGQSTGNPSKLEIITLNNERIVFKSIPMNIETTVKSNDIIQYHIPAKSNECKQDKVSICYNNNNCNYENGNDEMYFSSINENDFTAIVNLLTQDKTKIYQSIRLLFDPFVSVYEDVCFNQIPSKQVKQLRLTATSPNQDGVYIVLNGDIETRNFQNWLLDPFVFFWRGNENKFRYFDDVSNDFSSVTNPSIDIEDKIIEITDNLYNNYYIERFHIQSKLASVSNFGKLIFEIPNNNINIQYNENIILGEYVANQEGNIINNPKKEDLLKIYLHIQESAAEKQTIKINRKDGTIDQTNLIIAKTTGSVTIDFTCESEAESKNFDLNLYTMDNNIKININKNKCQKINTYTIPYVNEDITDEPTSDYSQSSTFELVNSGYISNEKGQIKTSELDKSQVNKIQFTQNFITISEEDKDGFISETPLYFFSYHEKSRILIKQNVQKSNIGVSSQNSPRVILEKAENSLSFMNEENIGSIELKLQQEGTENLIFKEMNNLQGQFYLSVSEGIKTVSFSDIKMAQKSSFEIRSSSNSKILQSDDETKIQARNSVNISQKSESTINNLQLDGTLNMYDDSSLILSGTTKFSDSSKINIYVQASKATNLLIECQNALNTIPSSINVLLNVSDKKIKIDDLKIIGHLSSIDLCDKLGERITVEGGKDLKVSPKCTETNNMADLSLSIKTKKKLGAGAIAGIVIACVVVVGAIIGIIVFFVIRKKNTSASSGDRNEDDSDARNI